MTIKDRERWELALIKQYISDLKSVKKIYQNLISNV